MVDTTQAVYEILSRIADPEIPVLTILDLGIVRNVEVKDQEVIVTITSTYTGCPAMDMIATQIRMELAAAGYSSVRIEQSIRPAWTTDWMSDSAKEKLRAYGIAPPNCQSTSTSQVVRFTRRLQDDVVACPLCGSPNTTITSAFGSTACKALCKCLNCQEPFDYFKPY